MKSRDLAQPKPLSTISIVKIIELNSVPLRPGPPVSGYFGIRNFFFPDSQISLSTGYRISCGFITFHSGRMRVNRSRIRKRKVGDSKISGQVWTGPDLNISADE